MLKIVTRIDDNRERTRRQGCLQPHRHLCPTDTTRQRHDTAQSHGILSISRMCIIHIGIIHDG
jgi:hypothetical protein